MNKQLTLAASKYVLKHLDLAADLSGLSRGQTFEDFLTFVQWSLAGQRMEVEYESDSWATSYQVTKQEGKVHKGEKYTLVVF